jgi:hypothetical protein
LVDGSVVVGTCDDRQWRERGRRNLLIYFPLEYHPLPFEDHLSPLVKATPSGSTFHVLVSVSLGWSMHLTDETDDDLIFKEPEKKTQVVKKKKIQTEHVNGFHYPDMAEEILQDLDSYMKWHKDHPGTTTPRKGRLVRLYLHFNSI